MALMALPWGVSPYWEAQWEPWWILELRSPGVEASVLASAGWVETCVGMQ